MNLNSKVSADNHITPAHIDVWGSFSPSKWQHGFTESAAYWLCVMAQEHGSWRDFTKEEIDEVSGHDFWFNKLIPQGDIIENDNKTYSFTDSFIAECYRLTPSKNYEKKAKAFQEHLTAALNAAKEAHSKLPAEEANAEGHSWQEWYAKYMITFFPHLFNMK